jgi:DNA-binding MarR family transcriptional regulator
MSHRATNWAIQQRGLPPAAKIVLWHLADRHNPDLGCFPTQAKLAEDCEMSRSSLNNQLALLEERGLILREQRKDDANRQVATWYRFAFEPEFEALKAAQQPAESAETGENRVQNLDTEPSPKNGPSRVQNFGDSVSNCLDTEPVIEPVIEPLPPTPLPGDVPPDGGEREGDPDSRKEAERSFKRFAPTWPSWVDDSEPAARRAWMALPPGERERAMELAPVYLAAVKGVGRTKTCALSVYLVERRWEKLAPSTVKAMTAQRQELPAYGKAWMAWRLQLLATLPARPWQPTAAQRAIIAAGKGHVFDDARRNAKYPLVHALDIDAERGLGRRLKLGEEVPDADSFVRIKRGSDEWHAWAQWHQERDWPWINPPRHVEWIFMPRSMPTTGEATGTERAA